MRALCVHVVLGLCLVWPAMAQGPDPARELPLLLRFDVDGNGRLDRTERVAAAAFVRAQRRWRETPEAALVPAVGQKLTPNGVSQYPELPAYAENVIRTIFLDFADGDWERELEVFKDSDVEVPATVTIDGVRYQDAGVHFRGLSSYKGVPRGRKRSLNVSLDWQDTTQAFHGVRTLNLLNGHDDPTFLRSMLFNQIAGHYLAAPRTNLVRVVINGESWGLYTSVQQFDKTFLRDHFATTAGARWKVPGAPAARGGLEYEGDTIAPYRKHFEIKSKDDSASWEALVALTRVLNTTPADRLEAALDPILDLEGTLRFLALDVVFVNNDGYWTRGSDYSLYRDQAGRFHVLPQDVNESFSLATPPGARRAGMAVGAKMPGGITLDPLVAAADPTKPLFSKLLAVPGLRERYLRLVQEIATRWLDPERFVPLLERYDALIAEDVKTDTKKLATDDAYSRGLVELRTFAEQRRTFLLEWRPPS